MRERRLARNTTDDDAGIERVTATVSRGTEDDRTASPLEIAVGDRLRIGATHWEKQLFNGTVVTVEELKVLRPGAGTGAEAEGRGPGELGGEPGDESPVLIVARTDDGRKVTFRHDEIRDWYGNIRLDHGYALTIAAAQGLTVDKTFLLVDNRPARETFYPAATRHREEIDVYVNRAPLALDVADRRADNDREAPVLDGEIRAYLAERWSRSVPKEAALDYMAVGDWEDRREDIRERRRTAGNLHHDERAEARTSAANDNALVRIARDVQRTAFAWRHGAAVDIFAAGRQEVLASWDELRARTRTEGDAVALGDIYRETLDRHAALLRQAEPFRARPEAFTALLAERGRIGRGDIDDFKQLHDRARRYRRAATMRHVYRTKQEAEQHEIRPEARNATPQQQETEARQGELALEGGRGKASAKARTLAPDTAAAPAPDRGETPVESAAAPPLPEPEPPKPDWREAWDPVIHEWNALVQRARQSGMLAFHSGGYAGLIPRIRALAENPDIPSERRESLIPTLRRHERHLAARERVEDFLAAADRHIERRHALRDAATEANVAVAEAPSYRSWRREAGRLKEEGEAILSDREACGPHLDNIVIGKVRGEEAVHDLGEAMREDDEELALSRREAREQRRLARRASAGLMFATDPDLDAAEADPAREAPARAALSRLGHVAGRLVGGADYEDRMRTEAYRRQALERSKQAMQKWNRQVERAVKEGVHVIYTDGCNRLRKELESVSHNFLLASRIAEQIRAVLSELGEAKVNAGYVKTRHNFILHSLERRETLDAGAARRGVAVPDLADYDRWRDSADEAAARGEHILENREDHGVHLHAAARSRESLASALSRVREMLADDDRRLAETFAGRRQGEDGWERGERVASLLNDPDELRKLRHQRAERRRAGQRQRKGRYQSRGITM